MTASSCPQTLPRVLSRTERAATLARLWQQFKTRGCQQARGRLIEAYQHLVAITAGRVIRNMPPSLERDDLVSAGVVGLIKAVDNYDMARNIKFETYAITLIRGAILEMLREDDWVPRATRERVKLLKNTYAQQELKRGRPATEEEMAEALAVTPEAFQKLLVETGRTALMSLEDGLVGSGGDGGEKLRIADVLQDDGAAPWQEAWLRQRTELLQQAVARLPERERNTMRLYYDAGKTFKEIGKTIGVSESRVYQLHAQALPRLRRMLGEEWRAEV